MEHFPFRAMGSECRFVIDGGPSGLVTHAHATLLQLEQKWSRFLPDSEITRVNRHAGILSLVSPETFRLIELATQARHLTGGRFNPLMGNQLNQLGYDTPWQDRAATAKPPILAGPRPASTEPIELFPEINAVRIPENTAFDPGGIGKGLAADLITELLVAEGATCTSVELGGDVRVTGEPWFAPTWDIRVAHPFDDRIDIATFTPRFGAVATSSTLRRRWSTDQAEEVHHLLDPTTGVSAVTDLVAVTASSSVTWWSEVAAKVTLIAGAREALAVLESLKTPGLIVYADGTVRTTADAGGRVTTSETQKAQVAA